MPQGDEGYAVVWFGHGFLVEGFWVGDWEGEGVEAFEGIEVLVCEEREFNVRWEGPQ